MSVCPSSSRPGLRAISSPIWRPRPGAQWPQVSRWVPEGPGRPGGWIKAVGEAVALDDLMQGRDPCSGWGRCGLVLGDRQPRSASVSALAQFWTPGVAPPPARRTAGPREREPPPHCLRAWRRRRGRDRVTAAGASRLLFPQLLPPPSSAPPPSGPRHSPGPPAAGTRGDPRHPASARSRDPLLAAALAAVVPSQKSTHRGVSGTQPLSGSSAMRIQDTAPSAGWAGALQSQP